MKWATNVCVLVAKGLHYIDWLSGRAGGFRLGALRTGLSAESYGRVIGDQSASLPRQLPGNIAS